MQITSLVTCSLTTSGYLEIFNLFTQFFHCLVWYFFRTFWCIKLDCTANGLQFMCKTTCVGLIFWTPCIMVVSLYTQRGRQATILIN